MFFPSGLNCLEQLVYAGVDRRDEIFIVRQIEILRARVVKVYAASSG